MLCGLSGLVGVNPLHHAMESDVVLANNLLFLKTLHPLLTSLLQKVSSIYHKSNYYCCAQYNYIRLQLHTYA